MKFLKKHFMTSMLICIFFTGISLLLYPTVSNLWNSFHQTRAIAAYTENLNQLDEIDYEKLWKQAEDYNKALLNNKNRWTPSKKEHKEYERTLNIAESGVIGYIEIPDIEVSLPIYHGIEDSVLQVAVGHIEGASFPTGEKDTHCVISGHRGLPSATLFTNLDQLTEGNRFILQVLDRTLTYEVDQIRIVKPDDVSDLNIEKGKDLCTLVTCTPYGVNSHRLLVRGHRIENPDGEIPVGGDARKTDPFLAASMIVIPLLLILLLVVLYQTRKQKKKFLSLFIILSLMPLLFPLSIFAREMPAGEKKASLTICYPCADASFQLYRAASIEPDGKYILSDEFAAYAISLEQSDQKGWADTAFALSAYIARDKLPPVAAGQTDSKGRLTFSSLASGLYLVTGDNFSTEGYKYTPKAFFISLPTPYEVDKWQYDVTVTPKYSCENETTQEDRIEKKVLKVWKDNNYKKRPEKIEVQLLQNGKVWDTVTLNDKNNWRYIWKELNSQDAWQIVEKDVPKGYAVTVSQEGNTFIATNKWKETPLDEKNKLHETKGETNHPEEYKKTGEEKSVLPQTGQLWWPVPILVCAGMILFLAGWMIKRKDDTSE